MIYILSAVIIGGCFLGFGIGIFFFGRKPSNKGEFTWEKTDKADLFKL